MKETGFECSVQRFLGCLEHSFMPNANNPHICHSHEYNLIFQAECNGLGLHTPLPTLEEFIEILWHPVTKLEKIDLIPPPLKQLITSWLESPDQAYMFYSWLTHV